MEDIQNFELGGTPGLMKVPADWEDNLPAIKPGEIAFYAYDDSYGTTNSRHRQWGYAFGFRHLPYAYMTQQQYLEWLVSLSYRLRHEWSDYHNHVYDPLKDTIATVESYILVTLGRLETNDKFFDRRELFYGASEFRSVMHPILAAYAFRPPQKIWRSPLSARYTEGADGSEMMAIDNVEKLARAVVSIMSNELSVKEFITVNAADAQVMAIMEDTLMALLARLQFLHGYVLNTYNNTPQVIRDFYGPAAVEDVSVSTLRMNLLSIGVDGQRRFLNKELIRYLEMFQLDDEADKPLHYLPQLRLKQAQAQGLVVPKPFLDPTAAVLGNVGTPAVALPMVMPQKIPSDQYYFIGNPPNTTVMGAAAAAGGSTSRKKPSTQKRA
jgi:hypothetical protein